MPVYTSHIGSLLNGVSRQTPQLRLRSQGEEMINGYPTLQKGLGKRPPFKYVKNLGSTTGWTNIKSHWINRDSVERYHLQIKDGDLRVFDINGNEKTVAFPNGKGYLAAANPKQDFSVLTVADYTFIVNRTVEVAMDTSRKTTVLPYDALVHVRQGNYGRTIKLSLNDTLRSGYAPPDGASAIDAQVIGTTVIARILMRGLQTNTSGWQVLQNNYIPSDGDSNFLAPSYSGTTNFGAETKYYGTGIASASPWAVTRYANSLHIENSTTDFTIDVTDDFNGNAIKVIKEVTNSFANLPPDAPDGFRVKIAGDTTNEFDDYWVEYNRDANSGEGQWKECVAPDTVLGFNLATMPHVLVRESDGTFTFKQADWNDRNTGDEHTAPEPAFVGQKINDISFYRNRLALFAGENVTLSRAGEYFNFWIETVTTALDTDPIDIGLSTDTVATINHGVVLSNDVILFADQRQLRLTGGDLLTPQSVAVRDLSSYLSDSNVKPVVVGERIYFLKNFGQSTSVREYWVDQQTQNAEELEVTNHCPEFIPGGVFDMAGASNLNVLALLTGNAPNRIYVHNFFWAQDGSKPQSAWGYWEFPSGHVVRGVKFYETDMYVLVEYNGNYHLMYSPMEVGLSDTDQDWLTYLDYRMHSSDLTPVYDAGNDWTTVTLPYLPPENIEVWTAPGGVDYGPGSFLEVAGIAGNVVRIAGDVTAQPFYIGIPFTFRWRFSPFVVKDDQDNPMVDGRVQVVRMKVWYGETAAFTVDVTPKNRNKYTYDYNAVGLTTDDPETLFNDVVPQDGAFGFPVKCEYDRVWIDLVNDTALPSWFVSAEVRALFQPKYRRAG